MFLGIDIGTSSVKVAVVNEDDRVCATASSPLEVLRPAHRCSEQHPQDWWTATRDAVRRLPRESREAVRAIGLSGQMHGATVLDAQARVLRPAILWNDTRSGKQCDELEDGLPELSAITGNRATPGFTAPKLLWLRRHEPEVFARIAKVLLPKDYVRLRLTGEYATDLSDAAGTLWLDVAARRWSEQALAACDLSPRQMPHAYEGNEVTGRLLPEVAGELGLRSVPVAAGAGDNAAGAIGAGVICRGQAMLSLGTSGVIFVADDRYRPNCAGGVHTFCHALPARWHQMSVMLSAAASIDWAAGTLGLNDAVALHKLAESRGVPCSSEFFLPYLTGERTPHNDALAQGAFFGLTASTDRQGLAQAVLEGVAFGLADGLDALRATGVAIESLSVIGGASRAEYWGRILAAVLGVRLVYRDSSTVGPAVGAARLARLAMTRELAEDVCIPPPQQAVVDPDPRLREIQLDRLARFRKLYPAFAPLYRENTRC